MVILISNRLWMLHLIYCNALTISTFWRNVCAFKASIGSTGGPSLSKLYRNVSFERFQLEAKDVSGGELAKICSVRRIEVWFPWPSKWICSGALRGKSQKLRSVIINWMFLCKITHYFTMYELLPTSFVLLTIFSSIYYLTRFNSSPSSLLQSPSHQGL